MMISQIFLLLLLKGPSCERLLIASLGGEEELYAGTMNGGRILGADMTKKVGLRTGNDITDDGRSLGAVIAVWTLN